MMARNFHYPDDHVPCHCRALSQCRCWANEITSRCFGNPQKILAHHGPLPKATMQMIRNKLQCAIESNNASP
jgi:hypothetical protein